MIKIDYKKYKNKYISLKNQLSMQTGGNKLEKAWIWFTLDERSRSDIINCANDITYKTNLPITLKKQNQIHISLITISVSLEDRIQLNNVIKRQLNYLLHGNRSEIILIPKSDISLLPVDDPRYLVISFEEYSNYLSIIRFNLRQEIINYFKNKYVNMYEVITKKNQPYKDYEILTYDALRLFDINNKEVCNFRLDEYQNEFHVSLNARFTDEQQQQILKYRYKIENCLNRPLQFINVTADMFEYKEKTVEVPSIIDKKPLFFIHNIKINGQPVLCESGLVKTVKQFLEKSYALDPTDIRVSVRGGSNPPCGDKINKNLLQIHILKNIPKLNFSNDDQLIINGNIDQYSTIYMKIQKSK